MTLQDYHAYLTNLGLYGLFELGSLVLLIATLQAKYNLPLMAQVRLTMREYKWFICSTAGIWFSLAFLSPLEHFGTDYSFGFLRT